MPCAGGSFSVAGSTSAKDCLSSLCTMGYYCYDGQMTPCQAGTYGTSTGNTDAASCLACEAGFVSAPGSTACTQLCPNGSTRDVGETSLSCILCAPGFFCAGGLISSCPGGTYSAAGNISLSEVLVS